MTKEVYALGLCAHYFLLTATAVYLLDCLRQFTMMVFIHCTGGPDITLARHDGGSRRASDAQVTLTDAVPMPVVSNYTCPCQRQSLYHHAMRVHESVYSFCWLGASLPLCPMLQLAHSPVLVLLSLFIDLPWLLSNSKNTLVQRIV